ncbi:hypothetical protein [Streptomyces rubiginosohelvolus]|uniref:XRE family transcriptional regulator n=1 Tax=Streptomyces rubiginosohelvolus TaxID=67362 RepID=A0ABQ3BFP5_9ACTN|nr:hypothetical protein [Streptomyces pluricolorescens]GGZ42524.1 hypothetical protein GCM10010328_15560 [Streptomyces pluricolorescens]
MKSIVAGREPVTATEFVELALGIDLELFTGSPAESAMDRAARLDVAREVLADLRENDPETAAYAESLLRELPLTRPCQNGRRARRTARRPLHNRASGVAVAA